MESISDLTLSSFSKPLHQELACGTTLICSSPPAKSVQWCTSKCVEQLTGGLSLGEKSTPSAIEGRNSPSPRIRSTYAVSPGPPRKDGPSSEDQLKKFKHANGGIISIRTLFGQWVLKENELCDDEGPGNPSGGSFGGGGGGDDGSRDGFSRLPEGGNAYFLVLLGRFFRDSVSVAGIKLIIPALFVHCLLYININAHAEAITSPAKTPLNTAKIEENAQEAKLHDSEDGSIDAVFELRGGHWRRFLINVEKDEFVIDPVKKKEGEKFVIDEHSREDTLKPTQGRGLELFVGGAERSAGWCWDFIRKLMLPEGYPESVTGDYLEYTLWRMGQGIASQINGVLTTQALLYAVGLGKGAIPTAAAVNWVLKDGIGYLGKILLAKYGRHFDVHPKGWRLLADLIENASCGLELLTPAFPHLFVYLGAAAGAGRSASGLIQAATRSCFYAGFAAQRNFAEVIAKGEAQGMVSKSLGIVLGIAISGYVGSSGPLLVATFIAVSGVHMVCNLRSYQAVQLRTLNPYRASLVFGEYIRRGVVASVEEVNAEEPIFTEVPFLKFRLKGQKDKYDILSLQTKEDAAVLANKLKLGVTFGNVIRTQQEADALFNIYQDEQYVLAERQNEYQVLLKMRATSHDLLRMMLQVCYLYQLRCGSADLNDGGALETSYKYMADRFERVQQDLVSSSWVTSDGLVSRPLPYRVLESIPVNPVSS